MSIDVTAVGKHLKILICELIFYPNQYFYFSVYGGSHPSIEVSWEQTLGKEVILKCVREIRSKVFLKKKGYFYLHSNFFHPNCYTGLGTCAPFFPLTLEG